MKPLIALLSIGAGVVALAGARQAGTRQVEVLVSVVRPLGTPVDDLPADAFTVEVDDRVARVERLRQVREPMNVALLVDVSGSMSTLRWVGRTQERTFSDQQIRDSVLSGLFPAVQAADRARLAAVRTATWIGPALAPTRAAFDAGVEALLAFRREMSHAVTRSSPIWDAVDVVVRSLRGDAGRRLVVLISDGKATANQLSPEELAIGAVNARVAVAVIDESQAMLMRQDDADRVVVRPDRALRWIAAATGGGYFADAVLRGAPERADPAGLVRRAIDGHRRAYTLTLTVPANGGPQTLKVAVRGDDLIVRAPAFIPAR